MNNTFKWLGLQLFADGAGDGAGAGDAGAATAETGATTPDAGENRLRELGVPESVLQKRAKRANRSRVQVPTQQANGVPNAEANSQQAAAAGTEKDTPEGSKADEAAARMSWDEIMADPEYNKQMQSVIQARLKASKGAEDTLSKLAPAIELLAQKHGLDAKNLDAEALAKAVLDDDALYEEKALEMGVPVETAKKIEKSERETAQRQAEEAKAAEEQKIRAHLESLQRQCDALKDRFPNINLQQELQNPTFFRMTSPSGGISVEDAYYAVHRKEIQAASMKAAAQNTAKQMANAIRSGQSRPVENGTSTQAPSVTSFDYAHATREQREAIKRKIREAAAHGKKLYPGQV